MDIQVLSRRGQTLPRRLSGISLAGDSLPLRLRSVTVGIVGLVAAAGLGLVGLIYQQSWPAMLSAPLPQGPGPALVHNDTIAPPPSGFANSGLERRRPVSTDAAPTGAPAIPEIPDLNQSHQAVRPAEAGVPASPSPSQPGGHKPISSPSPTTSPPAPSAPQTKPSPDAVAEAPPPPTPPLPEDDAPGNSGQAPGHATGGHGPPPWAGTGKGHAVADPGKPSWAGH